MVLIRRRGTLKKTRRVPPEAAIIGQNLCALRRRSGLTQQEVAALIDVSFQQIQKYERGENRLPVEKLHILKNYFSVPYDDFFAGLSASYGVAEKTADMLWIQKLTDRLSGVNHPELRDRIYRVVMILAEP